MDALTRRQFDRAMFAKDRTLAIRVGDYASRDIKEASFEYGYIKGDTYKPGGTCAGSGKITFTSIITTFNKLDVLHPEIGLLVGNTYQWVKMGEYFINDIEIDRNRNTTTLELMDGMFKLNREYVTDLHFPAEVREVIQEICLKTGIELANDYFGISAMRYHVEQVPEGKKLSFRDMLSSMTQMIGMSCFFNREGKMEIRDLTESNITINADSYFLHGLTKSEIEYQIAGITCKTDKKPLTVGMKTGRSLELDNVFMTQSALNDLYYKLKNLTYYPYNLNYQGHLLLEVGQWVTIQTNKKETFKVPVLSQSFTFKGGLRGRISADSKAGNDTQYSYEGTITKQIKQQDGIEAKIQAQIEAADKDFDQKVDKIKKDFNDQVELAKAKAEEVKQDISNEIDKRFQNFDNASIQEARRKAEESLKNAGASSLLAQEAKQIGLDSIARLEAFKLQTTTTQTALSTDLDVLKRTVISEVNQASEYRRTTTEALSRMTGQMDGFATKSEVKQGIDGLTQSFAKMKVGSRNYAEDYDFSRGLWYYTQGDNSPQDWTISNGEYNVKGTTNTWKQMQIYSKEGSITSGKSSTALLDLEIGETYTLSFQAMCHSGNPRVWVSLRANRTVPGNPEIISGTFTLTPSWQTYQVTIPALTKPENFDFWRIILGYNEVGHVAFRKVELTRSSTRIDAGPAPEDGKTDLIAAKSEFEKTAEGLSMKLAAVESYVGQDSQRQEALQRYTREESARQATAVREQISRDYVGKSAYQEDVRGLERRFSAISIQTSNDIASKIAQYKQTVDGQFASITSQIAGKANQVDFQRVKETSQLYERIIGSNENDISNKVARMAMTNQLFQVEVSKNEGLKTVQRQLAGSWAVQNINSAGDIISGINLGANGHNRITGKLTHITGETLIDNAVIKSAMVDKLKTANFEAGSVTTTILDAEAVTAEKLKVDNALIRKITANEAFIDQLTSKRIFATRIESVISSSTVLEGYKGWIGGFQLGTHNSGSGRWITGRNQFSVGMGDGTGGDGRTALWVNWGYNWNEVGYYAWYVKNNGKMYCKNTAEFWNTPIIHGDLKVTGKIFYDNRENRGRAGNWVYSENYSKIDPDDGYLYLYYNSSGYNWIPMNKEISDRRYKSNIQDSQVSGLNVIEKLKTYSYRKEYDGKIEDISCGIMAQDVQKYAPEAFFENPDGAYSYRTFELVPYLIKAIQELNQKIEKMEKTIA